MPCGVGGECGRKHSVVLVGDVLRGKPMTQDEARQFVGGNGAVRRQQIVLMKSLLLKRYNDNSTAMLEKAVQQVGASKPPNIVLHPAVDPVPALRQFGEWISWWIAGCEALWGLVHS